MKKIYKFFAGVILTSAFIFTNSFSVYSYEKVNNSLYINVNGSRVKTDVPPVEKNDRMFVPLRAITEMLGGTADWDEQNETIYITYNDLRIQMGIGSKLAIVNGFWKYMDVEPFLYNDRTLVPIRFIAENMGMLVNWVAEANLATITEPGYFENLPEDMFLGYTTNDYKGDNLSYNSLSANYSNIDMAATFSHIIGADGSVRPSGESQSNVVSFANDKGLKPLMLVHNFQNGGFDINLAHSVLADDKNRKNLVDNILITLSKGGYSGVNIDIEHIYWYDRPYYTALIKELKETLTPYGFMTTAAVMAKTYDSYENNNWNGAFDYNQIGKYADRVLLMTYDEHYFGGPAGPVASYPWVESVLRYATASIPSSKLLLGLAGYGYDWSTSGTKAIPMKNIDSLITNYGASAQWDSYYKSPNFAYYKNGVKHEVWYENAQSISIKLDLVDKYKLGGVGLWKLGFENTDFWNIIMQKIN